MSCLQKLSSRNQGLRRAPGSWEVPLWNWITVGDFRGGLTKSRISSNTQVPSTSQIVLSTGVDTANPVCVAFQVGGGGTGGGIGGGTGGGHDDCQSFGVVPRDSCKF